MAAGLSFSRDVPAPFVALGLAALPFSLWEQYGTQLLLLLGKAEACSAIIIAGRSAYLVLVLSLLWSGAGAAGVILAFAVSQVLIAAAQGGMLWRAARGQVVRDGALPHLILDGLRVHWRFVGDLLLASASVLMLTMLSGVRESGLFQVALSLLAVPVVVPQAAAMVVTGHVGTLGANASWAKGRRILIGVTGLMIVAAILAATVGPFLIVRVLGSEFQESAAVFQMLCPLLVSSAVMRIMSVHWSARGLFKTASAVMLAAGLTNVALVSLLAPRLGMTGAVVGLLAAHALILCAETWLVVRCERDYRTA
jgi:O-antigen/teichoic acid export membrane protein